MFCYQPNQSELSSNGHGVFNKFNVNQSELSALSWKVVDEAEIEEKLN